MSKVNREQERPSASELERIIEPLASYICATDQPKAALKSALAVLVSEVWHTSRAANAHIVTFSKNFCS
jgi:hypothetical protein